MPEEMAVRVAEAAEVIVNGYALMKHDLGVRIVNLDTGNVAVFSHSDEMLETSMSEIELAIALKYLKANRQYMGQ